MGEVLIAMVYFVLEHEEVLLNRKEKKEGIKPCSPISWVFVGDLNSGP